MTWGMGLLLALLFALSQVGNWYAAYERLAGMRELISASAHTSATDTQIPAPCLRAALSEPGARAQAKSALRHLQKAGSYSGEVDMLEAGAYCLLGEQQAAFDLYARDAEGDPWSDVQRSLIDNVQGNQAEAQQSLAQANLNEYEMNALTQRFIRADTPIDTLILARVQAQKRPVEKATWRNWLNIGDKWQQKGDLRAALQVYQEALDTQDQLGVRVGKSEFLMRMGRIYQTSMKPKDPQKALAYYELARQENTFFSTQAEGWLNEYRGEVFSALRKQYPLQNALVAFQTALQIDPKNAYAALGAGNIYLNDLHNLRQAREYLEKAKENNPKLATVYLALGDLAQKEGNREAARQAYQQALQLAPDSKPVKQRLDALSEAQP